MLSEKIGWLFQESTEMYCEGSYEACVALLSDCLALQLDRSILYSNRAIAHYHLRRLQDSHHDLERALATNHLNYIAYFNLFSIHSLNTNRHQSFRNLVLCLSSAYTVLCRHQPTLEWAEQAIRYCWNNKEALFLKAMIIYEKNQLRASLQILRRVEQLENHFANRRTVIAYIHALEAELGCAPTHFQTKSVLNTRYHLETHLSFPEHDFEAQITKMLKEFNDLYRRLNEQMQMKHELRENLSESEVSEKSEVEEEKERNRITTHNSTTISRNAEHEEQRSAMDLSRNKELKLLSIINQHNNEEALQSKRTAFDHVIYPLKKIGQKVRFFIHEAYLSPLSSPANTNQKVYAKLSYQQGKQSYQHRTSILEDSEGRLRWQEWTEDLSLTPAASNLQIKLLNKRYTAFKDDLLAEGLVEVSKSGLIKVPLFQDQKCNGELVISVEVE